MSKKFGTCALCGKECELTFEHIPPRKAFNSYRAKPVSGSEILGSLKDNNRKPWDISGLKYTNQQQGMGKYSLCKECNNNTGTWYGNSYVDFSVIVHYFLLKKFTSEMNSVCIKGMYPLRIIKQIISMFCSINSNYNDSNLNLLKKFVLNKDLVGIDKKKIGIYMYLTKSNIAKYAPLSVALYQTISGIKITVASEITAYPFGFVLCFDPADDKKDSSWIDITSFADCEYNSVADITFPICINEVNDILPTLYRSKEEIIKCAEEKHK